MTLFKIILPIIMTITMIMIIITIIKIIIIILITSTPILQNITEKLEKKNLFSPFFGWYYRPRCYMPTAGKKMCYKITTDHK